MRLLKHIYKTRTLREYGLFLFVSFFVVLLLGNLFIPEFGIQDIEGQMLKIKGKHIKFDDDPHVSEFIRSVKQSDGYICMGTSESTPMKDGNYYEFLDQDTSYATRFSILGGAGWTCGLHMAMLLNHREEVDSLKLIYFINPVYWRSELSGFRKGYWTRYLNYGTYQTTLKHSTENDDFARISANYADVVNPAEKLLFKTENWFRALRKPFFRDLRYWLFPKQYLEDLAFVAKPKSELEDYEFFGILDTAFIDTSWNATYEFMSRTWLNPIVDADYRDQELKAFIKLCQELNVQVTFVLGPVNEIYIAKYHPPYLDGYQNIVDHIRALLTEENADFIDATDLGNIPGSFIDNQHHSSYGAYLIYQKIKKHLHEKNSL